MAESRTRRTRTAKTAAPTTPAKPRSKTGAAANANAAKTRKANARAKLAAKTPSKTPAAKPTRERSGPSPTRIALAGRVAKAREAGTKWSDVAASEGVSEGTLAKLRKDVRAGRFENVSPAKDRTARSAF